MKYIKMLGLLAVAAAALMAFAGAASATTITSSTGGTPTIQASSKHTILHNVTLGVPTTCEESSVHGTVTSHGGAAPTKPASGPLSALPFGLSFGKCTNHVTVLKAGSLAISGTGTTGEGTLTSSGAEVTIQNTGVGISCIYTTNNTHIGTLKGQTLTINSAIIPRTGHSAFCGNSGQWTGTYTVSHPTGLSIH